MDIVDKPWRSKRTWLIKIIRWIDGVEEDTRKLGCGNWRAVPQNRGCWRHLLEEAKTHPGL
jgi:hypothetical protein